MCFQDHLFYIHNWSRRDLAFWIFCYRLSADILLNIKNSNLKWFYLLTSFAAGTMAKRSRYGGRQQESGSSPEDYRNPASPGVADDPCVYR